MDTRTTKRIVCLANSRKLSGRCIAGKEILDNGQIGGWIRPVSDRAAEEVSEWERQYEDGSDPRVLDVLDVPLLNPKAKDYQRENWLLDPDQYWKKVSNVTPEQLAQFIDQSAPLWINGHSSNLGFNDRIPVSLANSLDNSLRLIRVASVELAVSTPGQAYGNNRRSVQGRFRFDGTHYWLRVTDPIIERQYLQYPEGTYPVGDCFVTVSIGEPFRGDSYKLIAAIIQA